MALLLPEQRLPLGFGIEVGRFSLDMKLTHDPNSQRREAGPWKCPTKLPKPWCYLCASALENQSGSAKEALL